MCVAVSGDRDAEQTGVEWLSFNTLADPLGAIVALERRAEAGRVGVDVPVPPGNVASKADNVRRDRIRRIEGEVDQEKNRAVHGSHATRSACQRSGTRAADPALSALFTARTAGRLTAQKGDFTETE
jgi:hypothetical protein